MNAKSSCWSVACLVLAVAAQARTQPTAPGAGPANPAVPQPSKADGALIVDPAVQEGPLLTDHTQLTFRDHFIKAGEAYFSADMRWIIFQAIAVPKSDAAAPKPEAGKPDPASSLYAMYVAKLIWDADRKKITGIDEPVLISPPGSANTCGWFHPTEPGRVIFGSTLVPPSDQKKPGFQVGTNRYVWAFPTEMEIVTKEVGPVFLDHFSAKAREEEGRSGQKMIDPPHMPDQELKTVFKREGYDAECSYSKDGRFILYANVDEKKNPAKPDADIWVYDTETAEHHPLVVADGYDGGPFWSPDNKRICYRSDRKGDDKLQVFIADVVYDKGVPVGTKNETAITANEHVNWCPFWHPSGEFLVYATSEIGHTNYEVFAAAIDAGKTPGRSTKRRVTFGSGADVLPAFSPDGKWMMWTSQRGPKHDGEAKPSSQLWIARWHARDVSELFAH